MCRHPNIAGQHSAFLWNGPHVDYLYPLFAWAKTTLHSDLLVTPLEQFNYQLGRDPSWQAKKFNKLLWRGSSTGPAYHRESRWRSSQRARLVISESDLKSINLADGYAQ